LDRRLDRYSGLGLGLIVFGAPSAVYSYVVLLNTPLTALGLACVVLGGTLLLVPGSPVPRETVRAMVEASCVNVEALLEEFDVRGRGVYLPPKDGRGYVYVPLKGNPGVGGASAAMRAPTRVFVKVEGEPALMVFPPGSEVVRLSGLGGEAGVEEALGFVLVDFLEAVHGVKAIREGGRVVVEYSRPVVGTGFPRFVAVLGSLPVSIGGSVLASVLGAPVELVEEESSPGRIRAVYRVHPVG
jgi:hypothetical protein